MVDIRVATADKQFTLQVIDTGVGMDRHAIENLLSAESTKSTTGTKNEKGTGLGLLLCKEYLQKAGGQLTVESTPGKGSTFTIQLPVNR